MEAEVDSARNVAEDIGFLNKPGRDLQEAIAETGKAIKRTEFDMTTMNAVAREKYTMTLQTQQIEKTEMGQLLLGINTRVSCIKTHKVPLTFVCASLHHSDMSTFCHFYTF